MADITTYTDEKAVRLFDTTADDDVFIQRATYIDGVISEKRAPAEEQQAVSSCSPTRRFCLILLFATLAISMCITFFELYIIFKVQEQDHLRSPISKSDADMSFYVSDLHLRGAGPDKSDAPYQFIEAELAAILGDTYERWPYSLPEWQLEIALNSSQNCLGAMRHWYLLDPCLAHVPRQHLAEALNDEFIRTTNRIPAAYCTTECTAIAGKKTAADHSCHTINYQTPQAWRLYHSLLQARESRARYCMLDAPADATAAQCVHAVTALNKTEWITQGRPQSHQLMPVLEAALEDLVRRNASHYEEHKHYPEGVAKQRAQRPLTSDAQHTPAARWTSQLRASVCGPCFWEWVAGSDIVTATSYLQPRPYEDEYIPFVRKYYAICTGLGADWLAATEPVMVWDGGKQVQSRVWDRLMFLLNMDTSALEVEPPALQHVLVAEAVKRVSSTPEYEWVKHLIASWQRAEARGVQWTPVFIG